MKKRIVSLLLAVVISLGVISVGAGPASAESVLVTSDACIEVLKAEEGFVQFPMWDYAQYTVGYGTRCPSDMLDYYLTNGITEAEAEALLRTHLDAIEKTINTKLIDAFQLPLTQNQFDALVMFSFNCGTGWMYDENSNLRKAIISGAAGNEIIDRFARWCSAGNQIRTFLLRRRLCEANMYLNGVYSKTAPDNFGYVLYDAVGGVTQTSVQGFNTDLTSAIIPIPTYEGYQFAGWYTARVGGTQVTVLDASVKNTRLYAHWVDAEGNDPTQNESTEGKSVTLLYNDVNVRSGPGTGYEVVRTAHKGERFVITETVAGDDYTWGKFTDGWICLEFTDYDFESEGETETPETPENSETPEAPEQPEEPTVPEEPETPETPEGPKTFMGTVKVSDCLRIRSGPSTAYSTVGYLYNGDRVEILEEQILGHMTWGRIEKGWISLDYVVMDAVEETPEAPEATDPPATEPPATEPPATEPPVTIPEPESTVLMGTVKVNDFLRIRAEASTSSAIAGYLSPNARVEITETKVVGSTTWGKITKGWISLDYVVLDKTESDGSSNDPVNKTVTGTTNVNEFLRIRSGPSTSYAIAGYLGPKEKVEILEQKTVNGTVWGRIEKGWISLDYVILDGQSSASGSDSPQATTTKTVTASCLRIRSAAGTGNTIVGYLYAGAKVEILSTTTVNGVAWGRTSKGWISLEYTK